MRSIVLAFFILFLFSACQSSTATDDLAGAGPVDAMAPPPVSVDAAVTPPADAALSPPADAAAPPADAAVPPDLFVPIDLASTDTAVDPLAGWALYTIAPGAHSATVTPGKANNPLSGLISGKAGRDFQFVFDPTAMYTITMPAQPQDQLDWNKLPGFSDCNQFDLSVDGAMFGWRWRLDTNPKVLEVTAYANNASTHLTPQKPLTTLDADDLMSRTPLHYRVWIDGANYGFSIDGTIRGRPINVQTTLTRKCATMTPAQLLFQWASGFYFGGTSTSPSTITGRVSEIPYK